MNIDKYQTDAMAFRLPTADSVYAFLNLAAESGEVLSVAAKQVRDGGDVDEYYKSIAKELGDIMWMVAAVAADHNLSMSYICKGNLDKLVSRKQRDVLQGSGDDR